MPQTYKNKIIFGNEVQIDLTSDTAVANKVLNGYTFHDASGAPVTGTCDFDVDSSSATATADEVLAGETFGAQGELKTGSMPNRGAVSGSISNLSTPYSIQNGYHDGSGTVGIDSTEAAKMIPSNIRQDVTILGVTGTMSGSEDVKATTLQATPYTTAQTIVPGDLGDYNYFSEVEVAAIAYTETPNAAGGLTVTIGTVAPSA